MTAAELPGPGTDGDAVDAVARRVAAMLAGHIDTDALAQLVAGHVVTDTVADRVATMVTAQLAAPDRECWWETSQVMAYTGHGRTLVATDMSDGRLHSHQRGRQGKRYVKRSVVDAWMQGATPEQQATVCGCPGLTRWTA